MKSPEHAFSADVILLHPQARGWVALKSPDPRDLPAIRLNLFDNEADFATARAGLRLARRIYGTEPMAGLIARESVPGAEVQSDAEIDAHIRATAGITQHPVGTCAMRPAWSIPSCACTASPACAWSTPRSCPTCPAATPTARRS